MMQITEDQRARLGSILFSMGCERCKENLEQMREILKEIDDAK